MAKGSRRSASGGRWDGRGDWASSRPPTSARAVHTLTRRPPQRVIYPEPQTSARSLGRKPARVMFVSGSGELVPPAQLSSPAPRLALPPKTQVRTKAQAHTLAPDRPLTLCEDRQARREVLFAKGFGGSTKSRVVRRKPSSDVEC